MAKTPSSHYPPAADEATDSPEQYYHPPFSPPSRRRGPLAGLFGWFSRLFRFILATALFFVLMTAASYWVVQNFIGGHELLAPRIVGITFIDAARQLKKNNEKDNLSLKLIGEQPHDAVQQGVIISQEPAAGTRIKAGTPIQVITSLGTPLVTVPDLTNRGLRQAIMMLTDRGLIVGIKAENPESTAPPGTVVNTDPPAGTGVPQGSAINLMISASGHPSQQMPNLQGMTLTQANDKLSQLGLTVDEARKVHSDGVAPEQIYFQDPAPGETVTGTTRIIVSYEPAQVESQAPAVPRDLITSASTGSSRPALPDSDSQNSGATTDEGSGMNAGSDLEPDTNTQTGATENGADNENSAFHRKDQAGND